MPAIRNLTLALAAALLLAAAGCGGGDVPIEMAGQPDTMAEDPDIAPAGRAMAMPAGYAVRLDQADATAADFRVMTMGDGVHVQTGPHGVLYDEANTIESGDYSLSASFTEIGAPPNHREGLGLVFGGSDLQGENQRYSYFLVRADGRYLIKKRMGAETADVTDGWMASDAIVAAQGDTDVTNTLEVRIMGDMVHFRINGTEVNAVPAADLDVHGIAGLRFSHNLNVHVSGWSLTSY